MELCVSRARRPIRRVHGLTACKAFYFFYFASVAPFFPYINLYFKTLGLSGEQIGVIATITPVMGLLTQTVWGSISDSLGGRRRVLMLTTLGASTLSLLFLTTSRFPVLAGIMLLFSIFSNPIIPVADSITLRYLETSSGEYGRLRLWGSIGFSLVVPLVGWFLGYTRLSNLFILYSVLMFITCLASQFMPETQEAAGSDGNRGGRGERVKSYQGVTSILGNPNFMTFLFAIFILQAATMSVITFFPIHLSRMGASTLVIGNAQLIAAISEIPAFSLAGRIIAKRSSKTVVTLASATYVLRFLVYALSETPGPILAIQVIQGLGFALFYSAAVTFVSEASPPEYKTTGQTVFWALAFGGGAIAGNLVGGILFDRIGVVNLYLLASLGALVAVLLLVWAVKPNARARCPLEGSVEAVALRQC